MTGHPHDVRSGEPQDQVSWFNMVEPNSPRIDVDELMERVRADVARRRSLPPAQSNGAPERVFQPFNLRSKAPPSPGASVDLGGERLATLHQLLERARQATEVSKKIPSFLRQLFRKQGRYNSLLLQSVIPLFESVSKMIQWQEGLSRDLRAQNAWLADVARDLRTLQARTNSALEQATGLRYEVSELQSLQAKVDNIQKVVSRWEELQLTDLALLKSEVYLLHRRLSETLPAAPRDSQSAEGLLPPPEHHELDAVYLAFENRFRGNRDLIKGRVEIYLEDIRDHRLGTAEAPVLDLGCGRGEWLELLADHGFVAEGVDLNTLMVVMCRERGFKVTEAEAVDFLRSLPANSRGVITGFHLIEHLEFPYLMELMHESLRVLRAGGLVIFETPNPDNIQVGSNRFFTDPTHRHPLPKEVSQFLLETVGFQNVVIRPLHPEDYLLPEKSADPEVRDLLNRLFFGEQDYAVVGQKPGA